MKTVHISYHEFKYEAMHYQVILQLNVILARNIPSIRSMYLKNG